MKIDFYEEFPLEKNLDKLKLIKFKARIFILAASYEEFKRFDAKIKGINPKIDVVYWPIVKNSYYVSPFSNPADLKNFFSKLGKIKESLLIDIELPLKRLMILKNLFYMSKNKEIIRNFLEKNKERITVPQIPFQFKIMRLIGLDYDIEYEKNPMFYTSMFPKFVVDSSKRSLRRIKNKKRYAIGLGTIAHGILENEQILPPKNLEKDLEFIREAGFNRVIIFRLGGLNKKYIGVINKFIR